MPEISFSGHPDFYGKGGVGWTIFKNSSTTSYGRESTGAGLVASPYGNPIPIIFGKAIVPGIPIWSGDIKNVIEITTTDTNQQATTGFQGQVFGGAYGPTSVSQSTALTGRQVASFAVAFGTRAPGTSKVAVLRLWVNSQLVYDQTSGSSVVDSGQYTYSLYGGDETQLPDPLIQANEGAHTPAFRGLVYAVFKGFPLADSGGVFPSIMAEISCTSSNKNPVTPFNVDNSGTPSYSGRGYLINWSTNELMVLSSTHWDIYDTDNAVPKSSNILPVGINDDVLALSLDGKYAYAYSLQGNSSPCYLLSARTGQLLTTLGSPGSSFTCDDTHMATPAWFAASQGTHGVEEYLLVNTLVNGRCVVYERNGLALGFHSEYTVVGGTGGVLIPAVTNGRNKSSNPSVMLGAPQVDLQNFSFFYFVKAQNVYRVIVAKTVVPSAQTTGLAPGSFPVLYLPRIASGGTVPLTDSWTMDVGLDGIEAMDITFAPNEYIIYAMTGPADDPWLTLLINNSVLGKSYIRKYDSIWSRKDYAPQDLQFLDAPSRVHMVELFNIEVPYHSFVGQERFISQEQRRQDTYWLSYNDVVLVNFDTGEVQSYDETLPTFIKNGNAAIVYGFRFTDMNTFDPLTGTMVYPASQGSAVLAPYPGRAALWVVDDNGLLLSTLLLQYCLAAGYTSGDIDVAGVISNDTTIIGSIINTSVDLSDLLGQVCELFRVDIVESGGKIKFSRKTRGAGMSIDITLTDDDIAALQQSSSNDGTLVDSDRKPGLLPSILVTNYLDYDHLCAIGSQSAKKIKYPFATTKLTAQETLNVPVVMTATDAIYWTTFCLFDQWAGDTLNTIRAGQASMYAEPGDLVRLTRGDGKTYLMKAETTIVNADLSTSIIARTFNQYLNPVVPPTIPGLPREKLKTFSSVNLYMIDNFLFDPTNDPGDGTLIPYRYAVDGSAELLLLRGGSYIFADLTTRTSPVGIVVGIPLADRPYNSIFQIDDDETITVSLSKGDPASIQTISEADFLSGINAVVIGDSDRWELIYFRTVAHNADKTITLSHLLRGQRGTDVFAGTHTATDAVILLPFLFLAFPIAEYLTTEKFRAQNLDANVPTLTETWTSNGGPLRPWAPAQPKAAYSGSDIVLTWVRRTRLATALHDLDGITPLGETTEEYQVDIYKAGVKVRSYTGLTSPTVTYTAADQATDSNTGLVSIEVAIYQMSATVGHGWPRHVTIPQIDGVVLVPPPPPAPPPPPPPPLVTSYANSGGAGVRQFQIEVTSTAPVAGNANYLVTGQYGFSFYFTGGSSGEIKFDFHQNKVIDEAKWYQNNGTTQGTWKWQGSTDDISYIDIGSAFTLGGATTQTIITLNGNTTAYRYYKLLQTGGSTSSSPYCMGIDFKIDNNFIGYYDANSTGNRAATITVTDPGSYSGSPAGLVDGSFAHDFYFGPGATGQTITFQFTTAVILQEAGWYQHNSTNNGTWQWRHSPDNATWVNVGSTFTLGANTSYAPSLYMDRQTTLNGNTTADTYWQLQQVGGTTSSGPYDMEIEFKIG